MMYCLPVLFLISQLTKAIYLKNEIDKYEEFPVMVHLFHITYLSGELSLFVHFHSPNVWYVLYYVAVNMSCTIILEPEEGYPEEDQRMVN